MIHRLGLALRYFLIIVSILCGALWIALSTPTVSRWACTTLSEKLSKELDASVSIEEIALYPPLYLELRQVKVDFREKGSIAFSAINVVPLLLDLPLNRISLLYANLSNLVVELPLQESSKLSETPSLAHPIPGFLSKTDEKTPSHAKDTSFTSEINEAHRLVRTLFSAIPSHLYVGYASITVSTMYKNGKEISPPFFLEAYGLSVAPQDRIIRGSVSCTPLSSDLLQYVGKIKVLGTFQDIQAETETSSLFTLDVKGSCDMPVRRFEQNVQSYADSKAGKRTLQFACSLREEQNGRGVGTWSYSLLDAMDYVYNQRYLATSSKGTGSITLHPEGIFDIGIDSVRGDLSLFAQKDSDLYSEREADSAPIDLSLLSSRAQPLAKSSFSLSKGLIQFRYTTRTETHQKKEEKKASYFSFGLSRKKERASTQTSIQNPAWSCEYTFPHIAIRYHDIQQHVDFSRAYSYSGRVDSLHDKNHSSSSSHHIIHTSHLREEKHPSPLATLEAIWNFGNGLLPRGTLSFTSPILSLTCTLPESSKEIRTASVSVKVPSLKPFQFLSDEPIDGAISCLASLSSELLPSLSSRFSDSKNSLTPSSNAWQMDSLLVSASDFRYGSFLHVGNGACAFSSDLDMRFLLGTYLIKNSSIGNHHWVDISKGAVSYDTKKGIISLSHGTQKGSAWASPYTMTYEGRFEKKELRLEKSGILYGYEFDGIFSTKGRLGNDPFTVDLSTTIPVHPDGDFIKHADIQLSGKVGARGHFSMTGSAYDWQGRRLLLTGNFASIPSSIITDIALLPRAQGFSSGKLHMETLQGKFLMKYSLDGSFSWLDRLTQDGALFLSATGEINQSHAISNFVFRDSSQEIMQESGTPPLEVFLRLPVRQNYKHFPFFTFSHTAPIYGTINGSCDLQTLVSPWLEEEEWVEGRLNVRSKIRGSLDDQKILGEVSLVQGKLDILALGGVLSDISIHGTLYGKDIYIDDLRASDDKKGKFYGTGSLLLPIPGKRPFSWQAHADCSQFEIVNLDYAKAIVSGSVTLSGDTKKLAIEGKVRSDMALIDVSKRFTLPVPDLKIVYADVKSSNENLENTVSRNKPEKPFEFLINLSIKTEAPLEIKGRGLQSAWKGRASVCGSLSKPSINGSFSTTKGTFVLAGKDFNISQGNVSFGGDLIKESRLSVTAHAELPNVSARVLLRGTLDNPKASLESNPMKSEKEILSLILFNKEISDITPLESLQLASTAMSLDQTTGPLQFLDSVKKTIGIDTIDFSSSKDTTNNDVCVKVGKYVSQGVTVNVSKDFGSDTNRIGVEVEVAKNISAEAEIGDDSEGVISIKWKKDF